MNRERGCERVRGRLERYVDGALSALEQARDAGHLEACAGCQNEERRWRELVLSVGVVLSPSASEVGDATSGLQELLDRSAPPPLGRRLLRSRVVLSLATAAAAILCCLALQWSGSGLDPVARVSSERLVPRVRLSLPDWSEVIGGLLGAGELR